MPTLKLNPSFEQNVIIKTQVYGFIETHVIIKEDIYFSNCNQFKL